MTVPFNREGFFLCQFGTLFPVALRLNSSIPVVNLPIVQIKFPESEFFNEARPGHGFYSNHSPE